MLDLTRPITQTQFAALAGVSKPAVSAMLRDGTLSRGDTGLEWLQAYIGHLREVAAGRADTPAAQHSRERILAAEAHRREELAALATQKRQLAAGELMRVDDSAAAMVGAVQVARGAVWGWQGRLPPLLAHRPPEEIATLLEAEARELLEDMAATFDRRTMKVIRWCAEHVPPDLWRDAGPLT